MKINLAAIGIFMIVLGILVLIIGRKIPSSFIYSIILVIYGTGLFFKYREKK
ncbi:hypothetical protein RT41_GL000218 [Lactococcus fujiensis JCM 16395]|uniref:Uncharacterized protein n=1 Tax=Lactococcus fujiensis JCM 16395 TaxID=1291764 RepID=A0A2A5RPU6_9LACT|nr:hypothetical protein RT41_GL000218 [Lactococcus fujiensis JCM 16395]